MTRCRFCGERYIGNRDGLGTHLSSVLIALVAGLVTMATGFLLRAI